MFSRIVTGDETRVSRIIPESKQQSMEWRHTSFRVKVKAKQTLSMRKIMATVFWDRCGDLLVDYIPQGTTINSGTYCAILRKLRGVLQNKRRGMLSKVVLLLHDYARVAGVTSFISTLIVSAGIIAMILLDEVDITEVKYTPISVDSFFLGFGAMFFALGGAASFPTVQNDMKDRKEFPKSVFLAFAYFGVTGTNNNPMVPGLENMVGVALYPIQAVKAFGE
ncbi:uncharacterized protein TNCV_4232561 [Trichonephila clavipes]|nr:uncharacterized protein TNCV_4232561 [Trichonephila clavipes]